MKTRKIILAVAVLGIFTFFGMDVFEKEKLLKEGELVYFDTRSRDPRSLMQGDYMRLNYNIERDIENALALDTNYNKHQGVVVISPDSQRVARFVRLHHEGQPLHDSEMIVRFKNHKNRPRVGATSYLFEETTAECFSTTRYIAMRIDKNGNGLLTGLHDWDFCRLVETDSATYNAWLRKHKLPPPRPVNAID